MSLDLTPILQESLDGRFKGYPQGAPAMTVAQASRQGWRLLAGELGLPALVIRKEAMDHNRAFMRTFLAAHHAAFCPHGKTTMAPQLFARQLQDGAWGITVANVHQARVAHAYGVSHLTLANQVIHPQELAWIQRVHDTKASSEIRLLVDSVEGLAALESVPGTRPFPVLLELGLPGARAGVRNLDEARDLALQIAASPRATLRGVECFEALAGTGTPEEAVTRVDSFLADLTGLAHRLLAEGAFAPGEVWVSAGGSAYFDRVATHLAPLGPPFRPVLRSGCYLTHDTGLYAGFAKYLEARLGLTDTLRPALELWTQVLSRPEPGLAILNAGKRDMPHDAGLPMPTHHARRGGVAQEVKGWRLGALYDQHAQLLTPEGQEPDIGDLVALSPSHPCTAFDKWPLVWIVDAQDRAVEAVRTCF